MAEYVNRYQSEGVALYGLHSELEVVKSRLTIDGKQVDWIYPNVLPHYFTEPYLRPMWEAVRKGYVRCFSGFLDTLAGSKGALALLYEEAMNGELSGRHAMLVEEMIPPTYILRNQSLLIGGGKIDIWEYCLRNKDRLIAKKACGEQARGLVIGRNVSETAWREFLELRARTPKVLGGTRICRTPSGEKLLLAAR